MNYKETEAYIFNKLPMFHRVGQAAYKKDLSNTLHLLEALNQPHKNLKLIHIGGTNGKGSTSHILANILHKSGYKVGLYTSPHYKDYRERIKINGKYISKKYITDFIEKYKTIIEQIKPSFFEINTVLALNYFKDEAVDLAIIEVGLGGLYDSTNVITPIMSVITNISYDHQSILGNTLEEIATQKAGIIKPNVPVVIGETQVETEDIFRSFAKKCDASIEFADKIFEMISDTQSDDDRIFVLKDRLTNELYNIHTDLYGDYQQKNITTAIACVQMYNSLKLSAPISKENILLGLKKVKKDFKLLGRFNIISKDPLTIFDSAHNVAGITELLTSLKNFNYNNLHIVFGTVNDKDLSPLFKILPKNAIYYLAKADIPRGMETNILGDHFRENNYTFNTFSSVKEAYSNAQNSAQNNDCILVAGSIFVVAELL